MRSFRCIRKPLVGFVLLTVTALVFAACGDDGIGSDELGSVVEQSVSAAVAAAVPEAAPAGPSAAEISAMVQQAVEAAAPEGVSAAEIGALVEAALAAASEPAVTASEIEALVTQAVEQAAAGAATPLSASQVEAIVAAAIEAMPEPEPMVIAMPTAAPAEPMEVVVAKGTHRAVHGNIWQGQERMDPISATRWNPPVYLLWDQLTTQDFETGEVIPFLASSWESNEDASRWTFTLHDGVHSDGTPITSADVLYTTQRHLDPDEGSRFGTAQMTVVDPDRFETPDDRTIVFNLISTSVDFPLTVTNQTYGIVPDGSGDTETLHNNPVGSGPFTVESADPDGISVFSAREDYFLGVPLLGRITIVGIADADARVAAVLAGQIDMTGVASSITAAQASLFEGDPDFRIQESGRGQIEMFTMIVTEPPFDNLLLRQALKKVVDAEEMIAISGQGHGTPTCNIVIWPIDQYYVPQKCSQDIEGARALLTEAGYPDGITLELSSSNNRPSWESQAIVYKEQAAEAGITIEIVQRPADAFWSDVWMVEPFIVESWRQRWADDHLGLQARCGSQWNDHFWCSPEFDALQDQARATIDFDTRKALYQQAAQVMADEGGVIAPYVGTQIRAVNNRLQGLHPAAGDYQFPFHEFYIIEP